MSAWEAPGKSGMTGPSTLPEAIPAEFVADWKAYYAAKKRRIAEAQRLHARIDRPIKLGRPVRYINLPMIVLRPAKPVAPLPKTAVPNPILVGEKIRAAICLEFGLGTEIIGPSRRAPINNPRQLAFALLTKYGNFSCYQIGKMFGGRHHSTVLYGIRSCERRRGEDPLFAERAEKVEAKIREMIDAR